jgi:hypothetical protein
LDDDSVNLLASNNNKKENNKNYNQQSGKVANWQILIDQECASLTFLKAKNSANPTFIVPWRRVISMILEKLRGLA